MRITLCIALLSVVGGCTSDDYVRTEGVTPAAGNAQAGNTAMQMVDPWQYGVQNTRLLVPAQSMSSTASAASAASAKAGSGSAPTTSASTTSD